MLILITGVPGAGKTLYGVGLLLEYLKQGRQVYADIAGLKVAGVLPAPDDWRDCPDGSVVFYDECQQRFGPDGAGRSARGDIQDFEIHRHRGFDIVLITQHPKLLHAHIRRLIGRHHHVFRMFGSETAKVFTAEKQIDIDKPSQLRDQDSVAWTYPKEHYQYYDSATVHTHKRRLPAWLKRSVLGIVIVSVLAGFAFVRSLDFWTGESMSVAPVSANAAPQRADASAGGVAPSAVPLVVGGCIASARACRCWDVQGQPLVEMTEGECVRYVNEPLYSPTAIKTKGARS